MQITRRYFWFALPLLAASAGGIGFYDILRRMQAGTYNAHALPSPLLGHPLPAFTLPGIDGRQGFSNTDLMKLSSPILINWFASWCAPCQQESALLQNLADSGVRIWGIAYKDNLPALTVYLRSYGNPYQRLAIDRTGLTAINWGVYGVPETYFVDKNGIVRLRYAGPLNASIAKHMLMPLLKRYS